MEIELSILLASVIAGATPILLATLGETITEKAGIINLSLDGTILLSAMAAFVITYKTGSLMAGFAVGALVGAAVALVVALFSIYLEQSQVAVGFVLTLMTRDLAYFLGNDYSGQANLIAQIMGDRAIIPDPHFWGLRTSSAGSLGLMRFNRKDFDNLLELVPVYMRPPDIKPNPFPKMAGKRLNTP